MVTRKLTQFILLVLATPVFGCLKLSVTPPTPQIVTDAIINREKARTLSDSLKDDLLKDHRLELLSRMEKATRDHFEKEPFGPVIDQMVAGYGKPLEAEYKMDEVGRKTAAGGYDKPERKFWYATRTTKYEKGTVFLIVEVVPEGDGLAISSFSMVTFTDGVPPSLK